MVDLDLAARPAAELSGVARAALGARRGDRPGRPRPRVPGPLLPERAVGPDSPGPSTGSRSCGWRSGCGWSSPSGWVVVRGGWSSCGRSRAQRHRGSRARVPPRRPEFPFQAGQFAWIMPGRTPFPPTFHPFSISSSAERSRVEFTIKQVGGFTNSMRRLKVGDPVFVDGPHGSFTLERNPGIGYVFVGAGSGSPPSSPCCRRWPTGGTAVPSGCSWPAGRTSHRHPSARPAEGPTQPERGARHQPALGAVDGRAGPDRRAPAGSAPPRGAAPCSTTSAPGRRW